MNTQARAKTHQHQQNLAIYPTIPEEPYTQTFALAIPSENVLSFIVP